MKRFLLIIALFTLILSAYCEEENVINNQVIYKKDINYLLDKIGSFKPLFSQNIEEEQTTINNAPIYNNDTVLEQEMIIYGIHNKLNCKQMKTDSMEIVKRNLTFKEQQIFNKYMENIKNTLSQIEYIGTKQGLLQARFVLNQNGTISDVRVYASTFNNDFNKQIINQINQIKFMTIPVNIDKICLQYQFDNIYNK